MTATLLALTNNAGQLAGQAIVCVHARYCSFTLAAGDRPFRRFATMGQWKAIESELALGLGSKPLPQTSAIVRLLALEMPWTVRYVWTREVEDARPDLVVGFLDGFLREVQPTR